MCSRFDTHMALSFHIKKNKGKAGNLALKCGRFLALANVALITTKHIDFAEQKAEEITEQCPTTAEQVHNNFE